MWKSLFNKYLSCSLFLFCFRLCPTVSGKQRDAAEAIGNNQTQIGHRIGVKLLYNNELQICFRYSGEDE